MPDNELTALVERRDTCITSLMRIMSTRKGADDLRLKATNLLLDTYTMFNILKAKQSKVIKTPKKTQGRASTSANNSSDDWESLCREIDSDTTKLILAILNSHENHLAKLINKRLEEPDVDDDPIDPDDEPESDDEEEATEKQVRALLAEHNLCAFGGRLVQAVLIGALDDAVRKRMERNKAKLTSTWKEVVGHLDVKKNTGNAAKSKKDAVAKSPAAAKKSKEVVEVSDEEEEEEDVIEVQGDEIEDEEMDVDVDVDAEEREDVNGEKGQREEDEESILGD